MHDLAKANDKLAAWTESPTCGELWEGLQKEEGCQQYGLSLIPPFQWEKKGVRMEYLARKKGLTVRGGAGLPQGPWSSLPSTSPGELLAGERRPGVKKMQRGGVYYHVDHCIEIGRQPGIHPRTK